MLEVSFAVVCRVVRDFSATRAQEVVNAFELSSRMVIRAQTRENQHFPVLIDVVNMPIVSKFLNVCAVIECNGHFGFHRCVSMVRVSRNASPFMRRCVSQWSIIQTDRPWHRFVVFIIRYIYICIYTIYYKVYDIIGIKTRRMLYRYQSGTSDLSIHIQCTHYTYTRED